MGKRKAGHRLSQPEAASCLYWASFLRLQTWPRPLQPLDKGYPANVTPRGPQLGPLLPLQRAACHPPCLPLLSAGLCLCQSFCPEYPSYSSIRDAEITAGPHPPGRHRLCLGISEEAMFDPYLP